MTEAVLQKGDKNERPDDFMLEMRVRIDDREVRRFMKRSPERAHWALREAVSAGCARLRNKMREHIRMGGRNWPPLAWSNRKPLEALMAFVRFRVTASRVRQTIQGKVGFFWGRAKGQTTAQYRRFKERFKGGFGMTPAALAKVHEEGKRIRVTRSMRRRMAALGHPLRGSTRYISIPARPTVGPVWRRNQQAMPGYIGRKFFDLFFSNKNSRLKV